jgi:hypothetical protein
MPARVRFEAPACAEAPFDVSAFVALLQIELREGGVGWTSSDDVAQGDPSLASIALEIAPCNANTRAIGVTVQAASTGKSVRRAVSIGDAPAPLRARLLALAVAELVRSSWSEIGMAPVTAPPVLARPAAPALVPIFVPTLPPAALAVEPVAPPTAAPPPSPPRVHLSAAFEARALVGHLAAEGGRLGASIALSSRVPLRLTLDGGALFGTRFDRLGSIDVVFGSGALGLVGQLPIARAIVELGPEIELGGVWARGHAFDPAVAEAAGSAFIVATSFGATVRGRLGDRVWLSAALRGGAVLRGAELLAETREAGGFTGAMLGVRAGLGFDL